MKSIIEALKNKQVMMSSVLMFFFQLFISTCVIIILFAREDIYVIGAASQTEGIMIFSGGSILAGVISIGFYFLFISRLRTTTILVLVGIPALIIILALIFTPFGAFLLSLGSIAIALSFAVWLGIFIYGLANLAYFKLKNVYLALAIYAFWFFGVMALAISSRIDTYGEVSVENAINNIGLVLDPIYIISMFIFFFLSILLILLDTKISISRWSRDLKKETKLGWKNIGALGCFFILASFITIIVAPAIWRLNWVEQERSSNEENRDLPPDRFGRQEESPKNGNEKDTGGHLEQSVPQGSGKPVFVVKLGESDKETALDSKYIYASLDQVQIQNEEDEFYKTDYVWRAGVFDAYSFFDGFYSQSAYSNSTIKPHRIIGYYYAGDDGKYLKTETVEQKYHILNSTSQQVFSLNRPFEANYLSNKNIPYLFGFDNETIITDDSVFLQEDSLYYIASEKSFAEPLDLLQARSDLFYDNSDYYLIYSFPNDLDLRALALDITSGIFSDYEKTEAIQQYLRENYKLENSNENEGQPLLEADIKKFLLGDEKVGTLSEFSAAMVRLLYEIGIDARIAGGFAQGDYDEEIDAYVVYDYHFFYWVEVYFDDYGWIEFFPNGEATEEEKMNQQEQESEKQDLNQEEKENIEDNFEEFDENDNFEKREEWEELNDEDIEPFEPDLSEPPDFSSLEKLFGSLWKLVQIILLVCCPLAIFLVIIIPPLLKYLKYSRRKGLWVHRSEKEQIVEYFEYLQDVLADFKQELKLPETSIKFVKRFVEEFPIEERDKDLDNMLHEIAEIYNHSRFAQAMKKNSLEIMKGCVDEVIFRYLETKGIKRFLRWFMLRGTLRK